MRRGMIVKKEVLDIIDEVMNNREIDSIRNAILAIRDKVKELSEVEEPSDCDQVTLRLRGGRLSVTDPFFEGATHVVIDPWEKIDSGIYGSIRYIKKGEKTNDNCCRNNHTGDGSEVSCHIERK